jgi:hypothetical protein
MVQERAQGWLQGGCMMMRASVVLSELQLGWCWGAQHSRRIPPVLLGSLPSFRADVHSVQQPFPWNGGVLFMPVVVWCAIARGWFSEYARHGVVVHGPLRPPVGGRGVIGTRAGYVVGFRVINGVSNWCACARRAGSHPSS